MITTNLEVILFDIGFFPMESLHVENLPHHYGDTLKGCLYKKVHNGKGIIGIIQHKSLLLKKGATWYTSSCTAFYAVQKGNGYDGYEWLVGYDELYDTLEVIDVYLHLLHKPILLNITPHQWAFKMGTLKPAGTPPPCWKDVLTARHRRWWGGNICISLIGELDAVYSLGTHCKWGTSLEQLTGCSTIPLNSEEHHSIDYTDYEYNRKMSKC
jgi:hypothetical protein